MNQTAEDLLADGVEVHVAQDAVTSRTEGEPRARPAQDGALRRGGHERRDRAVRAARRRPARPSSRKCRRLSNERLRAARGRDAARRRRRRRPRPGARRGRLQHRDDRLPGGGHRPLLRGPDHHLHLSPDRQLRRLAAGERVRSPARARGDHARARTTAERPGARAAAGSTGWRRQGVPAIGGVDTRALVRHIRDRGAMRGGIFPGDMPRGGARADRCRAVMVGLDLAREVTPGEPVVLGEGPGPARRRARHRHQDLDRAQPARARRAARR